MTNYHIARIVVMNFQVRHQCKTSVRVFQQT
nr:MAG TPA: hypothetical protein [Caudoviricetes sp.]